MTDRRTKLLQELEKKLRLAALSSDHVRCWSCLDAADAIMEILAIHETAVPCAYCDGPHNERDCKQAAAGRPETAVLADAGIELKPGIDPVIANHYHLVPKDMKCHKCGASEPWKHPSREEVSGVVDDPKTWEGIEKSWPTQPETAVLSDCPACGASISTIYECDNGHEFMIPETLETLAAKPARVSKPFSYCTSCGATLDDEGNPI